MIYILFFLLALALALAICIYINPGPRVQQTEKTAWLKSVPIAHRGLHDESAGIPENSLAAFEAAVRHGYAIEMDVQSSADGQALVFHDYNLQRMTGLDEKIADLNWEEISKLKLSDTDEGIPLFSELLALVGGSVPLLIEIKNEGSVGALEQALIDELQNYSGEFAVQSFNPFVVAYFTKHAPEFIRGQLSSHFQGESLAWWKKFLLSNLLLNSLSRPSFIAYEYGALPGWFARRLRKKGLLLLTWTVVNAEDYAQAQKHFDNVIFEGFLAPKACS